MVLKDVCQRGTGEQGREGMQGPGREEAEGALEAPVISRDGTDRQRAGCRAWPLTFGELHVTAALGGSPDRAGPSPAVP